MPKHILLADDSITIQKVVGITFAQEDFELTCVDNGDDAVKKAAEIKPDIILADTVMPQKNGFEVCEAIKANPATANIPVLLLTGSFETFDEKRAQQVGAAGYIVKPFDSQALIDKVKEIVASTQTAPQPDLQPQAPVSEAPQTQPPEPAASQAQPTPQQAPTSQPPVEPAHVDVSPPQEQQTPTPTAPETPPLASPPDESPLVPDTPLSPEELAASGVFDSPAGSEGFSLGDNQEPASGGIVQDLQTQPASPQEPIMPPESPDISSGGGIELEPPSPQEDKIDFGLELPGTELPTSVEPAPLSGEDDLTTTPPEPISQTQQIPDTPPSFTAPPQAEPSVGIETPSPVEPPAFEPPQEPQPVPEPVNIPEQEPTFELESTEFTAPEATTTEPPQTVPPAPPEPPKPAETSSVDERQIRETVEQQVKDIIEKVVWEVVPSLAEEIIKKELERLLKEEEEKNN